MNAITSAQAALSSVRDVHFVGRCAVGFKVIGGAVWGLLTCVVNSPVFVRVLLCQGWHW
jgi:hypothetical protein